MSFEPVSSAQTSSENVVRYAVKRTDGSVAHLSKEEIDIVSKESQRSSVKAGVLARYAFLKDMAIFAVAALIIVVLLIYATQNSPARSYTIGAGKPSFQSTVSDATQKPQVISQVILDTGSINQTRQR